MKPENKVWLGNSVLVVVAYSAVPYAHGVWLIFALFWLVFLTSLWTAWVLGR